jgi:hypothetical protein
MLGQPAGTDQIINHLGFNTQQVGNVRDRNACLPALLQFNKLVLWEFKGYTQMRG